MALYLLACLGLVLVIQTKAPVIQLSSRLQEKSFLIRPLRAFFDLVSCNLCLGFWVGVVVLPLRNWAIGVQTNLLELGLSAMAVACLSYLMGKVVDYLESHLK